VSICKNSNKIKFPKIGLVKYKKSQEILGAIKTTSIKKEVDGWYVCISSEMNMICLPKSNNVIGIDLGIKDLVVTSDGESFENPNTIKAWQKKIKTIQKQLQRKKKGSNNRKKTIKTLAGIHQKVSRIRKDNLHKLSHKLVNENQVIICEKLDIKKMTNRIDPKQDENGAYIPNGQKEKSKLNKSIHDVGWGTLIQMLEYKSKWNERVFIQVNPCYTSQDCSCCNKRNSELKLSDRVWTCTGCNTVHNRDLNAAINIKERGINKLKEAGHVFSTFGYIGHVNVGAEEPLKTVEQYA